MTETDRQLIFTLAVTGAFTAVGAFAWRDIARPSQIRGRKRKLVLISAAIFSCNILLLYTFFGIGYLTKHAPSEASPAEFKCMLLMLWGSLIGIVMSILTVALALCSERRIARKLCIWGSSTMLLWWGLVNIVTTNSLAVYKVFHH